MMSTTTAPIDQEQKEPLTIDEDLVFKHAMTKDYRSIQELYINSEGLSFLDANNIFLKSMTSLRKLDLSNNKLHRIDSFDCMAELRELNLAFNRIEYIDNIKKLPNLEVLILDHNKIKKLENLQKLKKLKTLSLVGNLVEELSIAGATDSMN
jgi:Leucine-rich repeat (LRR) protein